MIGCKPCATPLLPPGACLPHGLLLQLCLSSMPSSALFFRPGLALALGLSVAAAMAQPASSAGEVGQTGQTGRSPLARTPSAAAAVRDLAPYSPEAQGALLYHNYCSVCHGDRGDGRSRATGALSTLPRDFTSAASRAELTPERIVRAVTYGRPGTAMVAWTRQLSATDIERVADHVWRRFVLAGGAAPGPGGISGTQAHGGREVDASAAARAASGAAPGLDSSSGLARLNPGRTALAPVPPLALDPQLGLPLGLKGDVRRGATFYAANCVPCHGSKGDGQGPRAYFINPPPRNFIDPATRWRLNRPLLFASIHAGRPGTEMPAWSKVASDQQIADVAEYVFRSFVLGGPQPAAAPAAVASATGATRP
jgi:mono/diheme cytochrome c family protein